FQIVLATGLAARPNDDNVLGTPAAVRAATADADFAQPVPRLDGQPQAGPSPCIDPQGFFLAGPPGPDARNTLRPPPAGTVPAATPRLQSTGLQYQHVFQAGQPEEKGAGLTVLLRRLANPHLPFDARPAVPDGSGGTQPNPW